jgi:hypothetical protein
MSSANLYAMSKSPATLRAIRSTDPTMLMILRSSRGFAGTEAPLVGNITEPQRQVFDVAQIQTSQAQQTCFTMCRSSASTSTRRACNRDRRILSYVGVTGGGRFTGAVLGGGWTARAAMRALAFEHSPKRAPSHLVLFNRRSSTNLIDYKLNAAARRRYPCRQWSDLCHTRFCQTLSRFVRHDP